MKTPLLAALLALACAPPPEPPSAPGQTAPAAADDPVFTTMDGKTSYVATQPGVDVIRQALEGDPASVIVTFRMTYSPDVDAIITGGLDAPTQDNRGVLQVLSRRSDPAYRFMNPSFYIWSYYEQTGQQSAFYSAGPVSVALRTLGHWPGTQQFDWAGYEFRDGGTGPQRPGIPMKIGWNRITFYSVCPNTGAGPVLWAGLVYVTQSGYMNIGTFHGPGGSKAYWRQVSQACGLGAAGKWLEDPATLEYKWCEHDPLLPGPGCNNGISHQLFYSW